MKSRRWLVAAGAVLLAALAVALALTLGGGGSKPRQTTAASSGRLTKLDWRRLWAETQVGQSAAAVLARWPKNPYQHYSDNLKDDCYEWQGDNLYNLCFKDGVLRSKELF